MSDLYPLLMVPDFDPRPWGTRDLSPIYPNQRCEEKIGEAWLTGDACKVANGHLIGQPLAELSEKFGKELVGDAAVNAHQFPLLLKFLFPYEKLSVQVHPDDILAQASGMPNGKTECWYVAHAKPGAQVGLGLKTGTTREQFETSIRENRAEDLLNWIDVYAGDMIYVAGGTVHTLGPGSVIIETQQQSDTTYRLYDYGRPRELHLKDGLAAIKEQVPSGKVVKGNGSSLITAPYFSVDKYDLKQPRAFRTEDGSGKKSAQILVCVEGCASVEAGAAGPVTLAKGDAVVVPASLDEFKVVPQWQVEFLRAYVPGEKLPEPETRL
ncbi:MAG TPA: type I phosphomannose isomerase catalytic subunit [Terriglobales bacterium]|jgi:mannose-6-phosphate isomerase|nr:type I phosphomannose isomerase catalytic subunit [Terriglobales bacterium]